MMERDKIHRNLSCVGQVCYQTESKESPMYIDLVMPIKGERMSLGELKSLISERLLPNNIRFRSVVKDKSFYETDVDMEYHV